MRPLTAAAPSLPDDPPASGPRPVELPTAADVRDTLADAARQLVAAPRETRGAEQAVPASPADAILELLADPRASREEQRRRLDDLATIILAMGARAAREGR